MAWRSCQALAAAGRTTRSPAPRVGEDGELRLDIRVQTRAVIENIGTILQPSAPSLADLVTVTTYLVDMDDFAGYNEVYGEYFDEMSAARTTIAVHSYRTRT